jgi:hypothetical protein
MEGFTNISAFGNRQRCSNCDHEILVVFPDDGSGSELPPTPPPGTFAYSCPSCQAVHRFRMGVAGRVDLDKDRPYVMAQRVL